MITDILRDAVRMGAIRGWNFQRRMLHPDTFLVVFNDSTTEHYTLDSIIDFCVGICIGRGEIPDPSSKEASYPC